MNNIDIDIPKLSADAVLTNGLNLLYTVAGIIAVLVIIIAGYTYVTSQGDSSAVTKAKNQILYAVIGLIIIFLAFAITWFVIGRFA